MSFKSNISLNVAVQLLNLLLSFLTTILVTRLLGAAGRGDYTLMITSATFMAQLFSFGLDSSISYYIASGKGKLKELISTILLLYGVIVAAVGVSVLVLSSAFPGLEIVPHSNKLYYIMLLLLTLIYITNTFFASFFSGLKEFNTISIITFCTQALTLAAASVLFFFDDKYANAEAFILSVFFINAVISLLYFLLYKKKVNLRPGTSIISRIEFKAFVSYSFVSFVCSLLHFLNMKMDFWIVHQFYGSSGLGIYSLSAVLAQLLWILPQSVAFILFPMSSFLKGEELTTLINKLCRVSLFLTSLLLPLVCIGAMLIPLLFGEAFREGVSLFYIFLIGSLPHVLVMVLASAFAGTGKIKFNLTISSIGFVVACLLYFSLIPAYGLAGGAVASSITYIVSAFICIYIYTKQYKVYWKDVLLVKSGDIKTVFAGAGLNKYFASLF